MFDESALCIGLPVVIKAREQDGKRLVEVEASNEAVDSEGDVILQQALLGSAKSFIRSGHLDIDHLSEIGDRLGIQRPSDYIVGVPTEVKDLGDGRTGVVGQLNNSVKAAEIWDSLHLDPPVRWQASIYGFPHQDAVVDARVTKAGNSMGATRFLVKALDWRSLAFTRNPINTSIKGSARVVTVKSFLAIMKSRVAIGSIESQKADTIPEPMAVDYLLPPRNREELMGHYRYHMQGGRCPMSGGIIGNSVDSFRNHFMTCCGDSPWEADIKALALMHLLKREKRG